MKPKGKGCFRHYTPAELEAFAREADATSIEAVIRKRRVSYTTVRRAMRIHGITPKRPGAPRTVNRSA